MRLRSGQGGRVVGRVEWSMSLDRGRGISVLALDTLGVYLLPRRGEYTRVYTTVYLRVYNCVHTCTQPRSKYILCRAHSYVHSSGLRPRHKRYG